MEARGTPPTWELANSVRGSTGDGDGGTPYESNTYVCTYSALRNVCAEKAEERNNNRYARLRAIDAQRHRDRNIL